MNPSNVRKQLLDKAATKYGANLGQAASYLSSRGFTKEVAEKLRMGVVGSDPEPGHELMVGRLSIPYVTRSGVVDLKFRCIKDHDCKQEDCVKYLCLDGNVGGSHLYNVNAFFEESDYIALAEGEFDTCTLHYLVGIPTVGCPGVQRWQGYFSRCFTGYERLYVFAHGDQAGRDFAKKVANELVQATIIHLPLGQDANSLFLTEGREALRARAGL